MMKKKKVTVDYIRDNIFYSSVTTECGEVYIVDFSKYWLLFMFFPILRYVLPQRLYKPDQTLNLKLNYRRDTDNWLWIIKLGSAIGFFVFTCVSSYMIENFFNTYTFYINDSYKIILCILFDFFILFLCVVFYLAIILIGKRNVKVDMNFIKTGYLIYIKPKEMLKRVLFSILPEIIGLFLLGDIIWSAEFNWLVFIVGIILVLGSLGYGCFPFDSGTYYLYEKTEREDKK